MASTNEVKDQSLDVLCAIGNTSIVRLGKVVPPQCADIYVKLEWENPTGSLKDRMAQAIISRAEEDGRPHHEETDPGNNRGGPRVEPD